MPLGGGTAGWLPPGGLILQGPNGARGGARPPAVAPSYPTPAGAGCLCRQRGPGLQAPPEALLLLGQGIRIPACDVNLWGDREGGGVVRAVWGSPRRDRHPPSPFPLTWGLVVEDGLGGFGRWLLGGGYLLLLGLAEIALAGLERGGGGRWSGPPSSSPDPPLLRQRSPAPHDPASHPWGPSPHW